MIQMIDSCQFQWPTLIHLFTRQEHLNSLPVLNEVRVTRSLVLCVMFYRLLFVLFLMTIVLSVLLRVMTSGYSFVIFKLFI